MTAAALGLGLGLALSGAALGAAAAAPGSALAPEPEPAPAESCLATADRLNELGRALDSSGAALSEGRPDRGGLAEGLEGARAKATLALQSARTLELEHGLRLPFLERFVQEAEKDESPRALAERLHFAAERLASTCKLLGRAAPAPAAVDRALVRSILARPEYELRSRDEQLLARLLQRVLTWFRDVFAANELVQRSAVSFRAFFLVATCLAVAWLAWRLSRVRLARRRAAGPASLGALVLEDPARYEAEAGAALERGEGREAIRNGMLSLLSALERARLATPGRAATNREVAEHVEARGGPPALVGAVRSLVGFYDRAWYSLSEVPLDEARRFVGQARAAREEAARPRPREAA